MMGRLTTLLVFCVACRMSALASETSLSFTMNIHRTPEVATAPRDGGAPVPYYYYLPPPPFQMTQYAQPLVVVPPLQARPIAPAPVIVHLTRHGVIVRPDPHFRPYILPRYPDFLTNGLTCYPAPYPYVYPTPPCYPY